MTKRQKNILHTLYLAGCYGSTGMEVDRIVREYGHTAWWTLWRLERKGYIKAFKLTKETQQARVRLTEKGAVYMDLLYIDTFSNSKGFA